MLCLRLKVRYDGNAAKIHERLRDTPNIQYKRRILLLKSLTPVPFARPFPPLYPRSRNSTAYRIGKRAHLQVSPLREAVDVISKGGWVVRGLNNGGGGKLPEVFVASSLRLPR